MGFRAIEACRICGSATLRPVLDLGEQALTGVFPRTHDQRVAGGPLEVVKCTGVHACGLVQLRHTYDPGEMYGLEYGYRSGLNRSMVEHLRAKAEELIKRSAIAAGDVVVDIGSNDGTSLSFYPTDAKRIGIDPSASKFAHYYPPQVDLIANFFSEDVFFNASGGQRAKLVTSIAMFYDLERPLDFMRQVYEILADGGIWHFEQSYLPSMLRTNSYDTVCHEHVEYYSLAPIVWMADRIGFSITDVALNDINGGSFAVTAVKARPGATHHAPIVDRLLDEEATGGLSTLEPFVQFATRVARHKVDLRSTLQRLKDGGKRILGLGASTKGNVLLQYCAIGPELLECIAEVNEDKFGCFTPGTSIPIVSEQDAFSRRPDVVMVLPWHFRAILRRRLQPMLQRGAQLLFPLPTIELVDPS
jgi:NDP-4-keto-2,6-dideoxyhexose 3-C-methyltransferase